MEIPHPIEVKKCLLDEMQHIQDCPIYPFLDDTAY